MYANDKEVVLKTFMKMWEAAPLMTVSEWADQNRILSRRAASEPGQWRTDRTPYLKEVMDVLSVSHPAKEIVFMKGAQIGATETGNNWVGYIIDHVPAPVMIVMPNIETAKRNSNTRIKPLLEECPSLAAKVPSGKSREKGNTTLQKEFPGGILVMTGANSAVGLRSMPVRFMFLDEIDGYPDDIDGEGDPISLAEARTRTFSRRKIYKVSTPTIDGASKIQKEFSNSDQRFFHVPCPDCGKFQKLVFQNLKWDGDDHKTALYYCQHCGVGIEEFNKTKMLEAGEWIPENPDCEVVGFHISSLYSPLGWMSWADIAKEFIQAKGNNEAMKSFVNTILGEVWRERGDVPEWKKLYMRREDYALESVHENVLFITMAVDVQKDRLEWEVKGWGRKKENWSIDFGVIQGHTHSDEVWQELDFQISKVYKRCDGSELPIRITAIDSGYETQRVYSFVRNYHPKRVVALKGRDDLQTVLASPRGVDIKQNGKVLKRNAVMLWGYGASIIKAEIYGWLNNEVTDIQELMPIGYSHFPMYDDEFFKQLTAEELIKKKTTRGYYKHEWIKRRDRNEALDLFVMNRAAASIIGLDRFQENDWQKMEKSLTVVKPLKKDDNKNSSKKRKRKNKEESIW